MATLSIMSTITTAKTWNYANQIIITIRIATHLLAEMNPEQAECCRFIKIAGLFEIYEFCQILQSIGRIFKIL